MPASAGDAARGKRRRMPAGGRGRRGRQRQPPPPVSPPAPSWAPLGTGSIVLPSAAGRNGRIGPEAFAPPARGPVPRQRLASCRLPATAWPPGSGAGPRHSGPAPACWPQLSGGFVLVTDATARLLSSLRLASSIYPKVHKSSQRSIFGIQHRHKRSQTGKPRVVPSLLPVSPRRSWLWHSKAGKKLFRAQKSGLEKPPLQW